MLKKKKSSLNLSINAIVILILAITMLGLGLTFMRGLFKQATGKVEAAVSAQELANPPTVDNPLTLYPSSRTLRKSEQGKILLAFMHAEGSTRDCYLKIKDKAGTLVDPIGTGAYGHYMIYNKAKVNMPADKIYTWSITIDPDDSTAAAQNGPLDNDIAPSNDDKYVGSHIYSAIIECFVVGQTANPTGTYKKDILIKITS